MAKETLCDCASRKEKGIPCPRPGLKGSLYCGIHRNCKKSIGQRPTVTSFDQMDDYLLSEQICLRLLNEKDYTTFTCFMQTSKRLKRVCEQTNEIVLRLDQTYGGSTRWLFNGTIDELLQLMREVEMYNRFLVSRSRRDISDYELVVYSLRDDLSTEPEEYLESYKMTFGTIQQLQNMPEDFHMGADFKPTTLKLIERGTADLSNGDII